MGVPAGKIIAETAAPKKQGMVIWYDRMKGHGFLQVVGYPADLYLHARAVRESHVDPDLLLNGTPLLCNVGKDPRGRPCAVDIELG